MSAYVGALVAVVGLLLVPASGPKVKRRHVGLRRGLIAGLSYGAGLAVLVESSPEGGTWPGVTQRGVAVAITLVAA